MKTYMVVFQGMVYIKADNKKIAEETLLDDLFGIDFEEAEAEAFEVDEED